MAQYHDPSDIVLACKDTQNYSYSAEFECLSLDNVQKFPKLNAPTWSLDSSGVKMTQAVYNLLSNGSTRVIDAVEFGPEYEHCILTPAGVKQLIVQGGYAVPVEP